ncbi:MAG: DUF1573 domain-containing protein [Chryseolinea sp.]
MKSNFFKTLFFAAMVATLATGCKDKEAEKKIALLESRLAELEGKKGTLPAATPTATPVAAPETKPEGPLPAMEFVSQDHDFGTINEGDVVEHTYTFKNSGAAPLIIQNAQGSCGCTASDWTKQPIPVGGTGFVKAKFDSNGKANIQNKTVTVTSNTWPKQTVLRFKAMVTPKDGDGPVKK